MPQNFNITIRKLNKYFLFITVNEGRITQGQLILSLGFSHLKPTTEKQNSNPKETEELFHC